MLLVCKSELRKELCLKADSVCTLHETLIALIRPGLEFGEVSDQFKAEIARSGLNYVQKMSGCSITGYSAGGICLASEV